MILTYHCNRRLWESGENVCWKREAPRKENPKEFLAVALMQQRREGFWKRSTLAHENRPANLRVIVLVVIAVSFDYCAVKRTISSNRFMSGSGHEHCLFQ